MFVTAGLSASAAVLAMAVQAGLDEQASGGTSYADSSAAADPATPADVADSDDE